MGMMGREYSGIAIFDQNGKMLAMHKNQVGENQNVRSKQ